MVPFTHISRGVSSLDRNKWPLIAGQPGQPSSKGSQGMFFSGGGARFGGGHDQKVAFILAMGHFGFVNDHSGLFLIGQLLFGKRITDDILGQGLFAFFVITGNSHSVTDTEPAGMVYKKNNNPNFAKFQGIFGFF